MLEALIVNGTAGTWLLPDPAYPPPAGLSWGSLTESAGFLVAGAAMIGVLIGAERLAGRRQPG